jgi:hypothetical protein
MEPSPARQLCIASRRYVQATLGLDRAAMRTLRATADPAWLRLAARLASASLAREREQQRRRVGNGPLVPGLRGGMR